MPMPEVVEWSFPGGGELQVYALAQRAGHGSCTLAVEDIEDIEDIEAIEAIVRTLEALGIDMSQRTSSKRVKTVMVTDPDGNHIAFAQAIDPSLAR
jgi:hypothetical protein